MQRGTRCVVNVDFGTAGRGSVERTTPEARFARREAAFADLPGHREQRFPLVIRPRSPRLTRSLVIRRPRPITRG
jgi:hypothetical protein